MRSRNMQTLTDQLKSMYPGIVVYGIGDAAHRSSPSGHNEDDTPGSRPEQEDPDSKPEHRAIDPMHGARFTAAEARKVVRALVTVPANRVRLLYVIHEGKIWSASHGWVARTYTGSDKHNDHVHVSGTWQDDENTAPWTLEGDMPDFGPDDVNAWTQAVRVETIFNTLPGLMAKLDTLVTRPVEPAPEIDYERLAAALLRRIAGDAS